MGHFADNVLEKILNDSLFGFYGRSTFVGYLMPNSFLYMETVLFQIVEFSINLFVWVLWQSTFVGYLMPNPFLYS